MPSGVYVRSNVENLIGQKFARLSVVSKSIYKSGRNTCWICKCNCGKTCCVRGSHLKGGKIQSCGCLIQEVCKNMGMVTKHGYAHAGKISKFYTCYVAIMQRCYNKKHKSYHSYGGRGIAIWEPWKSDRVAFIQYIEALPGSNDPKLSLDRINNDGNYEPGNLRWATMKQQGNNRRKKENT